MNQYKAIFLGTVDPNSSFAKLKRAVNTQKVSSPFHVAKPFLTARSAFALAASTMYVWRWLFTQLPVNHLGP
jgi:hypothetical protein